MKYIRLGHYDEKHRETLTDNERNTFIDECGADDVFRKNGHFASGEPLQSAGITAILLSPTGPSPKQGAPRRPPDSRGR